MEVCDGNDGALAASIAVATTTQLFVCNQKTSHIGMDRAWNARLRPWVCKKMRCDIIGFGKFTVVFSRVHSILGRLVRWLVS